MGSGITYNSRVSHLIFLLFIKKLRGLESKNTGGTLSCAFSSQRPVNIYRPREGSIIYFFGGGERRGCVVSRGNGVDMGRRQPSITDNGGGYGYYRALWGYQVNSTLTQPKSSKPYPPPHSEKY